MSSTTDLPPGLDPELAQRLEGLAARRVVAPPATPATGDIDAALAARIQRLAERNRATPVPEHVAVSDRGRRRHAAKKSRIAALALSLATTGGLTAMFAAIDGPSSSTITTAGGIVTATAANDPTDQVAAATVPTTGSAATSLPSGNPARATSASVVNGDVFTNRWGPVQVQATFAVDGGLAAVDAVQAPFRDSKSIRINDRAVPVLNSEALTAQSARVDTVSGATYTSIDYQRSLQSAIDTARSAGLTQLA